MAFLFQFFIMIQNEGKTKQKRERERERDTLKFLLPEAYRRYQNYSRSSSETLRKEIFFAHLNRKRMENGDNHRKFGV